MLIVAFTSAQLLADTPVAILQSKGSVIVNGKHNPLSTSVFAGDKVQTVADSFATLTSVGSTMLLFPGSSITVNNDRLVLDCGRMQITAVAKHISGQVSNLTTSPISDVAKYELIRSSGALQIAVREGSVEVNDGMETSVLEAGKAMTFTASAECPTVPMSPPQRQSLKKVKIGLLAGGG